jgi:hypothetical protein
MNPIAQFTTAAELDAVTSHLAIMGFGFTAELSRAARLGIINVVFLQPHASVPIGMLKRSQRPTVVVIGDDPGDAGLGPSGWGAPQRLLKWSRCVVLHAAGGTVQNYRVVVDLTLRSRRLLLIETTSARQAEWASALLAARPRPVPFLSIIATDGLHPATTGGF